MKKILVASLVLAISGTAVSRAPQKQLLKQVEQKIMALNREIDAKTQVRDKLATYLKQNKVIKNRSQN